ncbi:hypothetical protein HYQ46_006384 [Verticillium longisporum]|nr:hypothetical protein HYQ46_006384 [Verticillium longisporum]
MLGQVVTTVTGDKTLRVDKPELFTRLLLAKAAASVVLDELLGNTNTSGAGSHEDQPLLLKRNARQVHSTNVATENDSSSALDVVVEAAVLVAVAVEVVESLLGVEVLKLHNHVGEHLSSSLHELVHERLLRLKRDALVTETEVEGVLEVVLVVGARVENDGQSLGGVDTSGTRLAYRNANAVNAKITQTENARAVGNDTNLRFGVGPIPQHGADRLALLDGDVEGLGACVEGGVLEADVANGGGVDKRHELADVVDEDAVEEVHVLALEAREVQVLVDGR